MLRVDLDGLHIPSPKRNHQRQVGWEGFFPYYAGFSENFAREVLNSAGLAPRATVFDPWNGSGTTTYAATELGLNSVAHDLNPVMVVVARARLLDPSEADSIEPLAADIVREARSWRTSADTADPLSAWFEPETTRVVRAIERSIFHHLVGSLTVTPEGTRLDRISGIAATFYVALFAACRKFVAPFKSSNPTWLRKPKVGEPLVRKDSAEIVQEFAQNLRGMADELVSRSNQRDLFGFTRGRARLVIADTAQEGADRESVDFVLASPPYCTRIDYTAATRIELALLGDLIGASTEDLGRSMIGSTRVPNRRIVQSPAWGDVCNAFLDQLRRHPSKASSGYYLKTHLDYYDKMHRSVHNFSRALKPGGGAVIVVQDSYYKEIHNNLPDIITEMCDGAGLLLRREEKFRMHCTMAGINPRSRNYEKPRGAVEKVLCFEKVVA